MFFCCQTAEQKGEVIRPDVNPEGEENVPVEEPRAPPPKPVSTRPLNVKITSARGLRKADYSQPDPCCSAQIPGKPESKIKTPVIKDTSAPVWAFEAEVKGWTEGDPLELSVYDRDTASSDLLGKVTFPAAAFADDGFDGEVLLEGAGKGARAYLKVSIAGRGGAYPRAVAPSDEFSVVLEGRPLGLDLDTLDGKMIVVSRVHASGKLQQYNAKAPAELQVNVGDFICAINGKFGGEMMEQINKGSVVEISFRRRIELAVTLAPNGSGLGLDIRYDHDLPELLVRGCKAGAPADQCGLIYPGDRIVSLTGVPEGGRANTILEALLKAKDLPEVELRIARVKPTSSSGPVDISSLTRMAKDDMGLLPQPQQPKAVTALVQIYVRNQPFGGSDKSCNGHRYDSISIANGMINSGMSCQLIHYVHDEHGQFMEVCKKFQALVVRCNPGQIKADGGDQAKFDDGMRQLRKRGIQVWPSPDVMEQMGAKDALVKVASLNIGLEDTLAYYTEAEFAAGFKKTMAFQPRVIKQNRGSSGEGIWIIKLKSGNYCKTYGERSCKDDEVLSLMEANDNHAEEHTIAEFIEFCVNGRSSKSGSWTSKGVGKYLEGGKAAGGQLVDQRFCPRIVEGELRYNMAGDSLVGIIHKKPKEGGISAVSGTGSVYTFYGSDEPLFANLTTNFLERDMAKIMPALGLAKEPIPLWWTTDFINASPPGTKTEEEKWIVGEFNCSCVGISKCLPAYCKAEAPTANFNDIPPEDRSEARRLGDLMGQKALKILNL